MADPVSEPYVEPTSDPAVPQVTNTPADPKRLDDLEDLVKAVFIVIIISVGVLVISAAALVLDQLHFNNQIYRDGYATPTQTKVVTHTVEKPVFIKPPSQ